MESHALSSIMLEEHAVSNPVNSVGSSTPIQKVVTPPIQKQVSADPPRQLRATDRVELSGMSHLVAALKKNDIRADKVAEIKAQIAAGKYENDKKLDVAVDRLLDDLLK
jgi:negative regulator of flagellin synthesis FlgM